MKVIGRFNDFLRNLGVTFRPTFRIDSRESLLQAVETFGLLPFFPNNIRGLSVEEMCAPGMLFGGNYDEGCWEWKGPVIRKRTSAYGKFFRRKAGFVHEDLLPDFINYRRSSYPIKEGSTEELLYEIIRENDSITSTELKKYIFGKKERTSWDELPEVGFKSLPEKKGKSLESPLQRLQMGLWVNICDFEYKTTKRGERYGWGVARYSTPELTFGEIINNPDEKTPEESLESIINVMRKIWPAASKKSIEQLIK